jgi:flagellar FliJ protein
MNRQFPLAGLLRLRRLEQDQAAAHFGAVNAQLRAASGRQDSAVAESAGSPSEVADSTALRAVAATRAASASMLVELQALTSLAEREAQRALQELGAARVRTTGLEKLEARHRAEVAASELAAEQTVLDELSSARRGVIG